jgi:hypothetical protein
MALLYSQDFQADKVEIQGLTLHSQPCKVSLMTTNRTAHGVQFTECPACHNPIGTRGLARHLAAHKGAIVAPTAKKLPVLDRAALAVLRDPSKAAGYKTTAKKLIRLGYLTEAHEVTETGQARIA